MVWIFEEEQYHSRKVYSFSDNSKHEVMKFIKLYYLWEEIENQIQDLLIYNCKPYHMHYSPNPLHFQWFSGRNFKTFQSTWWTSNYIINFYFLKKPCFDTSQGGEHTITPRVHGIEEGEGYTWGRNSGLYEESTNWRAGGIQEGELEWNGQLRSSLAAGPLSSAPSSVPPASQAAIFLATHIQ